ncbi:astacin-like metalloprotease toxin 5 [Diabrotica undecimpunctata]|uniref:astacin-like metalloprotease toxin 5 n=1 Tax=Diabrotica undecimpunctata TaxID=50387 RepID=UPI003B63A9F8
MHPLLVLFIIHIANGNTVGKVSLKKYRVDEFKEDYPPIPESPERSDSAAYQSRNGLLDPMYLWEDGRIPYVINGHFTQYELQVIDLAMYLFNHFTCVQFVPRTYETFYVQINNFVHGKCFSDVGKNLRAGINVINLGRGCFYGVGAVVHELMHTVGFDHEQTRYDRDYYVTVNYHNLVPGTANNFRKIHGAMYNLPYDYDSVMHYAPYTFSVYQGGGPQYMSIVPKDMSKLHRLGQSHGFSKLDITKINIMYNCQQKTAQMNLQDGIIYSIERE